MHVLIPIVDKTGLWDYTPLEKPSSTTTIDISKEPTVCKQDKKQSEEENPLEALKKSIVSVDCYPPFVVDGLKNSHSYGAGVIISMNPPLILCDRDTVPIGISVISVTFDNSLTISADLVFMHPYYNFAVLKFDPSPVIQANIDIHVASLDDSTDFQVGDYVNYVGLSGNSQLLILL